MKQRRVEDVQPTSRAVQRQEMLRIALLFEQQGHRQRFVRVDPQGHRPSGGEHRERGAGSDNRNHEASHRRPTRGVCATSTCHRCLRTIQESRGGPSSAGNQPRDTGDEKNPLHRQHEHEQQSTETTDPASKKIRAVDHVDPAAEVHQGKADHRRSEEKRNKQQHVIRNEEACLLSAEEDELWIQREQLGPSEAHVDRQRERKRQHRRPRGEPSCQFPPRKRKQRTTYAKAQERRADDEVREVVPLRDRKGPEQGELESHKPGRQQEDGRDRQSPAQLGGRLGVHWSS